MEKAAPITVSQLNRQVKTLLEQGVGRLWVEGEISNIAKPASGHIYFSLKDKSAQIRAAFSANASAGPQLGSKMVTRCWPMAGSACTSRAVIIS